MSDAVNHPKHYTNHPSGIECIQITEHMGFNLGNVIKYVWRADLKGSSLEDLRKARWYLDREIGKRELILLGNPEAPPSPPDTRGRSLCGDAYDVVNNWAREHE